MSELLTLVIVGALLASVVLADLVQDRAKLLQQACAANMKQWGMAISMYMEDYNGVIYYDVNGVHFSDQGSPLQRYFGNGSLATLQMVRACPARVGLLTYGTTKGYEIVGGQFRKGVLYKDAFQATPGNPYFRDGTYWPDLKSVPVPAQYLLMTECYNTLSSCALLAKVSSPAAAAGNVDPLPPLARHGNAVNCLFGDFHVELVSSNRIAQQNFGCNTTGNPWFNLN